MKLNYITCLFFLLVAFACQSDKEEDSLQLFELSETALNFESNQGQQTFEVLGTTQDVSAIVSSEDTPWCSVELKKENNKITGVVAVEENVKVNSRTALIEVSQGTQKRNLIIRQSQKYFSTVSKVQNLQAEAGPGCITLSWEEPGVDNFDHVMINIKNSQEEVLKSVMLEKGVITYTADGLLSTAGEYLFEIQSYDKENEAGEIATISCRANKKVAFQFKDVPEYQYIGYYFKSNDESTTTFLLGSNEFNDGEEVIISFEVDPSLIKTYNEANNTDILLMPAEAYSLPDFSFKSTQSFQTFQITVNTSTLQDRKIYALPVKIAKVSANTIEESGSIAFLIYHVDDLQGWYTVERLPKCGEPASKYSEGARRYIKRTGDYTWETGYLFSQYTNSTDATGASSTQLQFIKIDPETKTLHIQQGDYETIEDLNVFDPVKEELHIEYLYAAWAGWWTHERMFNRSVSK